MAWQAVALLAATTAMKVGGSLMGGLASEYAANYNKKLARAKAQYSKQAARVEEKDIREQVGRVIGSATATAGASGFATDSGSSQDAIDAIVRSGELDAAMIIHRGDIGAWEANSEAELYKSQKKTARALSYLGAGTDLVEGGMKYGQYKGWFKKK